MLRRYSDRQVDRILQKQQALIARTEQQYGLPAGFLKAVIYQELMRMDWVDLLADAAVRLYWGFYRVIKRPPPFGKRDSSTGYGQVFAATAIDSIRFAAQNGLPYPPELGVPDRQNSRDLWTVWRRLNSDRAFNFQAAALTLLRSAQEMTGRIDFATYTPEETQLIFTRYNADTRRVTAYGREAYQYYISL